MATSYQYAGLDVLDGNGRGNLNEELLDMDDANPALTAQHAPGTVGMVAPPDGVARLSTSALSDNIGRDPDIEVLMVGIPGSEQAMRDWIETPQGRTLRSHALSVQPWVYSASIA